MRRHSVHAFLLVLGTVAAPMPVSAAAPPPCNPPTVMCNDGDGIDYPCRPCRPHFADGAAAPALERYRESLEEYRLDVESARAKDGATDAYRKGLQSYREGIAGYRADLREGARASASEQ